MKYETDELGIPKKGDAAQLIEQVRDNIENAWSHDRDNRRDQSSDIAFCAGDQWPEATRREREDTGRPMLTINRLPQFIRQVTNDIRQADLAIKVSPVDDDADEQLTDVYNGLLKQIHYRSNAHHVYATACEHQATGGLGWFRIETDYEDDSAFDQEIKVAPIRNPMSIYCDPGAVLPTREDAHWIAVTQLMPKKAFKRKYPKAKEVELETPTEETENLLFWSTSDDIRIAEYWWKEPVDVKLALLEDGSTIDLTDVKDAERQFFPIVKTRTAKTFKVQSAIVSGAEILEGPFEWPGKHIPIVAVVGGEFPLDSKTYRYGVVRFARDAQQLYNYARTSMAEMIGLAPKAPIVATAKQIGPYLGEWNRAGKQPVPYLRYDHDPQAPGAPQRIAPVQASSGFMAEVQQAAEDMKATTGIYDAALGAQSNETSGRAILARDHQGDVANYHFIDNLRHSMTYAGKIIVDLIPKIYDNERLVRLMGDDDSEKPVMINQVLYADDGMPVMVNDLSRGRFDIRVQIGKSYSTKRLEQADTMVELARANPAIMQVAGDLLVKALDMPGGDDIAERLKRTIPPHITADEDQPPPGPPEPDPMQVAGMEAELSEKAAKTAKTEAETRKTNIEADQAEIEGQMAIANMFPNGLPPVSQFIE